MIDRGSRWRVELHMLAADIEESDPVNGSSSWRVSCFGGPEMATSGTL